MSASSLFALAFDSLTAHIALLDGVGQVVRVNSAWRKFAQDNGCQDPLAYVGVNYLDVCRKASLDGDEVAGEALRGIESVRSFGADAFEQRYPCHAPDCERWYSMTVTRLDNGSGLSIAHSDVTALVEAELAQRRLVRELNHRVKNTLAIVQGLAQLTALYTPEPLQFAAVFASRLNGLARVHDVLTQTAWNGAQVKDVVEAALVPFCGEREPAQLFRTSGPAVCVDASTAVSLHLAIQELATNATKYGALGTPEGRIDVMWFHLDGGRRIVLEWFEQGTSIPEETAYRGFGTRFLEAFAAQGGAKLERKFSRDGLRLRLELMAGGST